jgi:hypothetical protein
MLQTNTLLAGAAVVALTLGVTGQIKGIPDRETLLSKSDIVVVIDDTAPTAGQTEGNAEESAKMGKEEGTNRGTDVGATPESDTKKIEQPPRQNPTTSGGAMDNKGTDTNTGE